MLDCTNKEYINNLDIDYMKKKINEHLKNKNI